MRRRVVVTGIGLCTPLGLGREATWKALIAGQSGIAPITHFDTTHFATKFAGEVKGLDPSTYIDKREAKHMDPFVHFALYAASEALAHAGLKINPEPADKVPPPGEARPFDPRSELTIGVRPDGSYPCDRIGVYMGAGLGGVSHIEIQHTTMTQKGPGRMSPYFVPQIIINIAPGLVSIREGIKGPNMGQVSACSTSAHAIGEAARAIAYGDVDAMVAGGSEATVSALGVGGFNAMRAMSTRNDAPTQASRPFDKDRDGFVIGEGAGVVILEEYEHAKARGARIYAELRGYAANSDAHHVTAPAPEGIGAQRCMRAALADAGLAPSAIGYINAHGTSTDANDKNETAAIKAVFGDHARSLAVSSTKSMTGHMLGAAGSVECAISALVLDRGVLPPTINYTTPDPDCDLDYVPNVARPARVDAVMSNSFGFGGTNACLVLVRP